MPVRNSPKTFHSNGFRVNPLKGGAGFVDLIDAVALMHQIPLKLEKWSQQAAAANVGHVVRKARDNFENSIVRPSSKGSRSGARETGNFTFGVRSGGSMIGRTFKQTGGKTGHGFGFPDISKADSQTNFVWRSLEHGLQGSNTDHNAKNRSSKAVSTPSSLGLFDLRPKGGHRLPRFFSFDGPRPDGVMLLGRDGAKFERGKGERRSASGRMVSEGSSGLVSLVRGDSRSGTGIDGKHFIEQAWLDSYQFIERKYEAAVDQAMGVIRKGV